MDQRRPYRLKRRAERASETRRRIVDAAVDLHSTLGPARTSLSAIAARAGVQRHTLYAHFPNEEALFRACTHHWRDLNPFPDPARWETISEPKRRLRRALVDVYGWYESVADAFELFVRDAYVFPAFWAEREAALEELADALAPGFPRRRAVRAAIGHALSFETWRSLTREGLSNERAAELMVDLAACAAS